MSSVDGRKTGSIKWYSPTKRYGFIKPDSWCDCVELFFHRSAIVPGWEPRNLSPGGDVEYSIERDEVGRLRAVQVTHINAPCFACGKVGHQVRDCKDIPPGPPVICSRCGKWGHMARGCRKECYDCGEMGHIAVDCPQRQAPSSLGDSDVEGDESSEKQEDHGYTDAVPGLPAAAGRGGSDDEDDDDCVILENNPFVHREIRSHVWKKLIQNLINEFCEISSDKICKREVDIDEEETLYDCVLLENNQQKEESDDDCIVLEKNPFEEDVNETIINMSKKLSLSSDVRTMVSAQQQSHSKLQSSQEGQDHDELVIVAERGQVACRDYPHSRHLCVKYPFKDTPHHTYCNLCYCYVCDIKAPCKYWEAEQGGHCHASELEFKWIEMRVITRTKCP